MCPSTGAYGAAHGESDRCSEGEDEGSSSDMGDAHALDVTYAVGTKGSACTAEGGRLLDTMGAREGKMSSPAKHLSLRESNELKMQDASAPT